MLSLFLMVYMQNDDGPPSKVSPYVFGLYKALVKLGSSDIDPIH